ncbi:uncharacterized protein PgNI_02048, partial [Pyricularia grisea]|uniref:Uncharacterized protein n=1 Tax=Pyricularia grisea TaxID=148305 RepID=A0A6P8BFQ0_PYRGI
HTCEAVKLAPAALRQQLGQDALQVALSEGLEFAFEIPMPALLPKKNQNNNVVARHHFIPVSYSSHDPPCRDW